MFSPHRSVRENDIVAGTRELRHRGPDGEGYFFDSRGNVGLGHRRLAIIEPLNGQQPVSNETGTVHAVVNGEFYDHEKQRAELESHGHRFRARSDSETLVHLYEDHGVNCLQHLQGEFAFVLWDEKRQQLFAARDRFGVKPLVYSRNSDQLTIASEAKALFAAGVTAEWDIESFFFAANLQYLPPNHTLFKNISSLPASCYLVANRDSLHVHPYWQIKGDSGEVNEIANNLREEELVEQCQQHLVAAVKCRLRSDVPVCTQLSGGLDSSAVTGIVASITQQPVDAFSINFGSTPYDESRVAAATATHLGARLHSVQVTPEDLLQSFNVAVTASEGLAINGHLSAKYLMHRAMRQEGFKVALTGEGADEAFYGYAHLRLDRPEIATAGEVSHAILNQTSVGMMLPYGESLDLTTIERRLQFVPTWMRAKATLGWKVHQLLHPETLQSFRSRDAFSEVSEQVLAGRAELSAIETSRELWTRLALSGYILRTLGDGTEMPHSIEGRVPFLDHRLWEFLRSVPLERQLSGSIEKSVLRAAVRPYVTPEVYARPKHPLDAPPALLFAEASANEFFRDQLRSEAMRSQPFFCVERVERLLEGLKTASDMERQAWDPVFMLMLSTLAINSMIDTKSAAMSNASTEWEKR